MNRLKRLSVLVFALGLGSVVRVARAEEPAPQTVDRAWVVSTLLANNPSLKAAWLGVGQATEVRRGEEGRFPYVFEADAGYTRSETPALGLNGVTTSSNESVLVGTQLSRTFPTGTTATLRAEGQRFESSRPSTTSIVTNQPGVGYEATVRATVTQPLLRGYGTEVNEAGLRAARISETQANKAFVRQTSELLRDALSAYWELWYASRSVEIEREALALAKDQQLDARRRVEQGAVSPADALQFDSQVATINESLVKAQASVTQQALSLGLLVGRPEGSENLIAVDAEPEDPSLVARSVLMREATETSPAIAELEQALRLARENEKTAGDELRRRLDLTTWVEAAGLGAAHVAPALRQLRDLSAVSVYGGVTFETDLDTKRLRAARAQASYAVRIAESNLVAARQNLRNQASQLLLQLNTARASLAAAEITLGVARKQAELERQRFMLGASTPLQVAVAEDTLRQAQLRVARAVVDRTKAWLSLSHVSGDLLRRYPLKTPTSNN